MQSNDVVAPSHTRRHLRPEPTPLALPRRSTQPVAGGELLAVYDWPVPPSAAAPARATVLIVHGLGEHAGRYQALARQLNTWGFSVRAYDQYGHGESPGPRGALTEDDRLLNDLACMVDATRVLMPTGQPLVLLGHSMGGLVAALFVAQQRRLVQALVLSSPALDAGLTAVQQALVTVLPRVLPNLRVRNGLNVELLAHDPAVSAAYRADPLCHDRISARLARFLHEGGPQVLAQASQWQVPTLLLWAGADGLVNPKGSERFAQLAPPQWVQPQCYPDLFHELFNERADLAAPVLARLAQWLQEQIARDTGAEHAH